MPRLKDITCAIEYADTGLPFPEYGTYYGDGIVETYIPVPEQSTKFTVHLHSNSYIAPGLAMVVYVDGNYQCNRNRVNLQPYKPGQDVRRTEVDFRVRQKEVKDEGMGLFYGRQWQFDRCNIIPLSQVPNPARFSDFDFLGDIEVLVLRCSAAAPANKGSDTDSLTDREGDRLSQHTIQQNQNPSNGQQITEHQDATVNVIDEDASDGSQSTLIPNDTNYQAPTVVEDTSAPDDALGGLAGLFDGPSDAPNGLNFDGAPDGSYQNYQNNGQRFGWRATGNGPNEGTYGPIDGTQGGQPGPMAMPLMQPAPIMNHYGWQMPMMPMLAQNPWMGYNHAIPYGMHQPGPYYGGYSMVPPMAPQTLPQVGGMTGGSVNAHWMDTGAAGPSNRPNAAHGMNQTSQNQPIWGTSPAPAVYVNVGQQPPPPGSAHPSQGSMIPPSVTSQPNAPSNPGGWNNNDANQNWDSVSRRTDNQSSNNNNGGGWNNDSTGGQNNDNTWGNQPPNQGGFPNASHTSNNNNQNDHWPSNVQTQNNNQDNWDSNQANTGGGNDKWDNPGDTQGQDNNDWNSPGGNSGQANNNEWNSPGGSNNLGGTNNNLNEGWNNNSGVDSNNQNASAGGTNPSNSVNHRNNTSWSNDQAQSQNAFQHQPTPGVDVTQRPQPPIDDVFEVDRYERHALLRELNGPHGIYHVEPRTSRTAIEPEPLYDLPDWFLHNRGLTHQVRAGEAHLYTHKKAQPIYTDSFDKPYARFVFKYRRPVFVEYATGQKVKRSASPLAATNLPTETLNALSKDELVAVVENMQAQAAGDGGHGQGDMAGQQEADLQAQQTAFLGHRTSENTLMPSNIGLGIQDINLNAHNPSHQAISNPNVGLATYGNVQPGPQPPFPLQNLSIPRNQPRYNIGLSPSPVPSIPNSMHSEAQRQAGQQAQQQARPYQMIHNNENAEAQAKAEESIRQRNIAAGFPLHCLGPIDTTTRQRLASNAAAASNVEGVRPGMQMTSAGQGTWVAGTGDRNTNNPGNANSNQGTGAGAGAGAEDAW